MSLDIGLQFLDLTPTIFNPSVGLTTSPGGASPAPYVVKIVDMHGAVIATPIKTEPDTITWELNQPDAATFHIAKNAVDAGTFRVLGDGSHIYEAQIYRDGDLMAWGPVITMDAHGSNGQINFSLAGPDWYLKRRFVDGVVANHLSNAGFETGTFADWTSAGSMTTSIETDVKYTGDYAAKLSATFSGDNYIHQNARMGGNHLGLLCILSGWFYLEAVTDGALQLRGLYLEGRDIAGDLQSNDWYPFDEANTFGLWTKAQCQVAIPPDTYWDLQARLYAPEGIVVWDDIKLVAMDSVSTAGLTGSVTEGVDFSRLIAYIVRHCQDTAAGKSNCFIGTNPTNVGKDIIQTYQFVDHTSFDSALQEFIQRDDGIDTWVEITPTTRTFRNASPKKGTDRTGSVTLKFVAGDDTSNCYDYDLTQSGPDAITRQTVIGDDNGPTREVGEAVDASDVDGLILQDVYQAPQGSTADSLQFIANERLGRWKTVPDVITFYLKPNSALIHTLKTGDLVATDLVDGFVSVSDNARVQKMELNCVTNVLAVTVATNDPLS